MENEQKPEIQDYGITVEEYLAGMEKGIDVLELERLKRSGIREDLALEVMKIMECIIAGTATSEQIVRGLVILTPKMHDKLNETVPFKFD
jgi:hypothetical protein